MAVLLSPVVLLRSASAPVAVLDAAGVVTERFITVGRVKGALCVGLKSAIKLTVAVFQKPLL